MSFHLFWEEQIMANGGDRPLHFDQKWVAADLQRLQISLHLASKFILCRFADIAEFSAFDWNISFMQICRVCRGYLRPISGSAPALVERQRRKTPDSKVWIITATRWRCLQLSKTRIFDKFWKKIWYRHIIIGFGSVFAYFQAYLFKAVQFFPKELTSSFVSS